MHRERLGVWFPEMPHTLTCLLLGVSLSWFYKWITRTPTPSEQRRGRLENAVAAAFKLARGLHGSPRLHAGRPAGGRLAGLGEDGGGLDAPSGPGRPPDQAPPRPDPAGQDRTEVR